MINKWGWGVQGDLKKVQDASKAKEDADAAADAAKSDAIAKLIAGKKLEIFKSLGMPSEVSSGGSSAAEIASSNTWTYSVGQQETAELRQGGGAPNAYVKGSLTWCNTYYKFSGNNLVKTWKQGCK